jgi:hypothetical protein
LLALARYLIDAGELSRATALLTERIGALPAGPARAAAYLLLGEGADYPVEEEYLARAVADSAADPGLRAQALARQAIMLVVGWVRRIAEAEQIAGEALATAPPGASDAERRALVALAWARILRGRGIEDLLMRAAAMPPGSASLYDSSVDRPAGVRLAFRGELARAREVFGGLLAAAEQRGEIRSGVVIMVQLCEVELRAGDSAAAARVLEGWEQWAALEPEAAGTRARLYAALAAVRGDPGRAAALAPERVALSGPNAHEWDRLEALRAAGLADLLQHQPEQAVRSLAAVWEHTISEGVEDPGAFPVAGDLVEALAEADRPEEANEVIARLGRLATAQQHPWALATVERSMAMVRLADGYDDDTAARLTRAAAAYRALGRGGRRARPGQRPPVGARGWPDPRRTAGRRAGGQRPVE